MTADLAAVKAMLLDALEDASFEYVGWATYDTKPEWKLDPDKLAAAVHAACIEHLEKRNFILEDQLQSVIEANEQLGDIIEGYEANFHPTLKAEAAAVHAACIEPLEKRIAELEAVNSYLSNAVRQTCVERPDDLMLNRFEDDLVREVEAIRVFWEAFGHARSNTQKLLSTVRELKNTRGGQ